MWRIRLSRAVSFCILNVAVAAVLLFTATESAHAQWTASYPAGGTLSMPSTVVSQSPALIAPPMTVFSAPPTVALTVPATKIPSAPAANPPAAPTAPPPANEEPAPAKGEGFGLTEESDLFGPVMDPPPNADEDNVTEDGNDAAQQNPARVLTPSEKCDAARAQGMKRYYACMDNCQKETVRKRDAIVKVFGAAGEVMRSLDSLIGYQCRLGQPCETEDLKEPYKTICLQSYAHEMSKGDKNLSDWDRKWEACQTARDAAIQAYQLDRKMYKDGIFDLELYLFAQQQQSLEQQLCMSEVCPKLEASVEVEYNRCVANTVTLS